VIYIRGAVLHFRWEECFWWRLITWWTSCTSHIVTAAATARYRWNLSSEVSPFWQVYH